MSTHTQIFPLMHKLSEQPVQNEHNGCILLVPPSTWIRWTWVHVLPGWWQTLTVSVTCTHGENGHLDYLVVSFAILMCSLMIKSVLALLLQMLGRAICITYYIYICPPLCVKLSFFRFLSILFFPSPVLLHLSAVCTETFVSSRIALYFISIHL